MRDDNTYCSEKSHKKTRKDQLGPRGGSSLIHNSVKDVRDDVNEGFLLEFHEEDSSALLIVVSFLTGYKLNIMMVVRHLMSAENAVVLRHLPSLCPPMRVWIVSIDNILSL